MRGGPEWFDGEFVLLMVPVLFGMVHTNPASTDSRPREILYGFDNPGFKRLSDVKNKQGFCDSSRCNLSAGRQSELFQFHMMGSELLQTEMGYNMLFRKYHTLRLLWKYDRFLSSPQFVHTFVVPIQKSSYELAKWQVDLKLRGEMCHSFLLFDLLESQRSE